MIVPLSKYRRYGKFYKTLEDLKTIRPDADLELQQQYVWELHSNELNLYEISRAHVCAMWNVRRERRRARSRNRRTILD